MNPENRVVTRMPIEKLWDSQSELDLERISYLSKMEMKQMLRAGSVQYVIADPGEKLLWIDPSNSYSLWKNEIEPHFIDNPDNVLLEEFPNEYAYFVSSWGFMNNAQVVLLEKAH